MRDAYKVVTNGYHGAVIARAVGVSENSIVVADTRYKSVVETPLVNAKENAKDHVKILIEALNST